MYTTYICITQTAEEGTTISFYPETMLNSLIDHLTSEDLDFIQSCEVIKALNEFTIPNEGVGVQTHGEIVFRGGYGLIDKEVNNLFDPKDYE